MGPRAKKATIVILLSVGVAAANEGCRTPTQVTLDVTYNGPCSDLGGVAFIIGTDPLSSEQRIQGNLFTTSTRQCTEGSPARVGTLVVTPNDDSDHTSIVVLAGFGKQPEACKAVDGYFGCIIARRSLGFVSHTSLTLEIALDPDCRNVPCSAVSTCRHGLCVPANVECGSDGCSNPGDLPDGGIATVDAPTSSDAYVQGDRPEGPNDGSAPPEDAGVDAGVCEKTDTPLSCTTSSGPKTCAAGQVCCIGFGVIMTDAGVDGGTGGGTYDCRLSSSCAMTFQNPNVTCTSARTCGAGLVCCVVPMTGGGTSCMSKCLYPTGPDGGGSALDQACADDCECQRGGTCSVPIAIGTSPPQPLTRCSQ